MGDAAAETGEGGGIGLGVLAFEGGLGAEEAGLGEGEEAPEIGEAVLDGRAGEDEAVARGEGAGDDGALARGVFDELTFVEHDGVPSDGLEPLGVKAELGVLRDEDELSAES